MITVTRLAHCPKTRAYRQRRAAEQLCTSEIMRRLHAEAEGRPTDQRVDADVMVQPQMWLESALPTAIVSSRGRATPRASGGQASGLTLATTGSWQSPNANDPDETWDPDRLDKLLSVLGTEASPGYNGARTAQRVLWSGHVWADLRSRLGAADAITGNPFMDTRLGIVLARGAELPGVVEAVAAYPGEEDWRQELQPVTEPPGDLTFAETLIQLSRPLLLPQPGRDEMDTLPRAVDLAGSDEYAHMRAPYHDWFRDLVEPLRSADATSPADLRIDAASMRLAAEQLRQLWAQEQTVVRKLANDKLWSRVEVSCATLGAAGTVGLACVAALPVLGAGAALLGFAGWAVNRWRAPKPARSLGGGAMFVTAQRHLGFTEPFSAT